MTADADALKLRRLNRMRAVATGLLALMAVLYLTAALAARWWPSMAPALGYLRAFAEAGMVGACADWFAVSALFRRPFGLPIPHTGIIPRNKDRIGEALGGFIADNFLTLEVLDARLRQVEVVGWGGEWLRRPQNARRLARRLQVLLPEVLRLLPGDALGELAGSAAMAAARATPAAPAAGRLLTALWNGGRSQAAFEWALDRLAAYLARHEAVIQAKVEAQSWSWMPKFIDRLLARKITGGLVQLAEEMRDPAHPWRQDIHRAIEEFAGRLAHDPELRAQGEALKLRLLADPELADQARAVWDQLQAPLRAGAADAIGERLEPLLIGLGDWLHSEQAAQAKLNAWARTLAAQVIAPRRREIGRFVAQVVAGWDARSVVDKLELQVGRDLQFIRVNGTLVGGLVGLAIYAASRGLGLG